MVFGKNRDSEIGLWLLLHILIGVILDGDFIQSYIRYTICICNRWVSCAIWEKLGSEIGRG